MLFSSRSCNISQDLLYSLCESPDLQQEFNHQWSSAEIDPHYEEKHAGSVTDEVILELVSQLNGRMFKPVDVDDGFQYFVNDHLEYGGKFYKLIWLLEGEEVYIGIVNTYRR